MKRENNTTPETTPAKTPEKARNIQDPATLARFVQSDLFDRKQAQAKHNSKENRPARKTFEQIAQDYAQDPEKGLAPLALVLSRSVLRALADPTRWTDTDKTRESATNGGGASMRYFQKMRIELARDLDALERLSQVLEEDGARKNQDGETVMEHSANYSRDLDALTASPLSDSMDIFQTACASILEQTAKQRERDPQEPADLLRPFALTRPKKRVRIKDVPTAWETIETTPAKEVLRSIRRFIMEQKHISIDPRNGYTYLDDTIIDPASGEEVPAYKRLDRYSDLGGRVCDINGKEIFPTVPDRATVDKVESIVKRLELTPAQALVLSYRLRGYGNKAIATACGRSLSGIKETRKAIEQKARAIGIDPDPAPAK